MTDATATLAALGWRVSEEADSRGRPYFRAHRGAYVRGAHSLVRLAEVVTLTQQAVIEGERMERYTLHHGDCLEVLRTLPDDSVDAVVQLALPC